MSPSKADLLIVEDDPVLRLLVRATLDGQPYDIREADNGLDGLNAAIERPPDLILLDGELPGLDGIEVLRRLRANLATRAIPVIMVTGRAGVRERVAGLRSGADDYVVKPFEPDELVARIESTLRRSRGSLLIDPLTGLPANPVIREELRRRLTAERPFALCYADLDHFKAYVDHYGYEAASRVIVDLGRLCRETLTRCGGGDDFAGHIGGDDFVLVADCERAEALSRELIDRFEELAPGYYRADDVERGFIRGADRFGTERSFPLLSLSVALVDVPATCQLDAVELARFAAGCKEQVKRDHDTRTEHWRRFVIE